MNDAAWTPLGEQPVIRLTLSRDKMSALQHDMAYLAAMAGVRSYEQWSGFIQNFAALNAAMANAIDPRPTNPVTQALAGTVANTAAPPSLSQAAALQAVQSVLLNRRDDLVASAPLLIRKDFTDPVYQHLASRNFQMPGDLGPLPPSKQEELMETLLQPRHGRLEPAAHIHATALGHAVVHARLAEAFAPQQPAAAQLTTTLQSLLPTMQAPLVQAYANRWLERRHVRARQVADAYREESPLVQSAVRLSEENRLSRSAPPAVTPLLYESLLAPGNPAAPETTIYSVVEHLKAFFQPLLGMRNETLQ